MRSLGFAPPQKNCALAGRRIREARFESRSSLPASAACVVANGVRETLAALLGAPVTLRLCEPVIPDPRAWRAIARDALLYRVRGSIADAAIVLRASDAIAFAGAAFGEPAVLAQRPLSPIETDVVGRAADAIAANLTAVCGTREGHSAERVAAIDGFVSFFEMFVESPAKARIGIALSREPAPEPRGGLEVAHLEEVRVPVVATIDLGDARGIDVARLAVGAILAIRTDALHRCTLAAAGRRVANGACGVRNDRFVIAAKSPREIA
ncbi:MAG: hypothetical protein JO190_06505 [Candidatus Eremiobacteraeota bacterium]|nr:hypothetical protein [Candidatus Eremiobacteraeota bacterium]MBV8499111.1 hypothetical protein [Candidatus Eremiobacteraeota bacterium]